MEERRQSWPVPTLCWDCARACGGCSWSKKLIPMEGWEVAETEIRAQRGDRIVIQQTYRVIACPGFLRDAIGGGRTRVENGA